MIETTTVHVEGADLHVEVRGEGPPLLLLHGLTGTGRDWQHVVDLEELSRERRLVVPDARGHGRSPADARTLTFATWARDVLAILDHLAFAETSAIGLSLGAKTLLHVAVRAPERVSSMVLVSATPRFPEETRAIFRAAASAPRSREEWDAMRLQHAHGDEQIAALWQAPAAFAEDPGSMAFTTADLARITARTLVVAGDRDPLYPVELAVELHRGIPRSSLYVVPGGGHLPVFEAERAPFVARALAHLG